MNDLLQTVIALTLLPIAAIFWFGAVLLARVVVDEIREAMDEHS